MSLTGMTPGLPLPQHIWDALPVEARVLIEALQAQVEALQAEVATLKARLDANAQNSSKPPSTDPPLVKRQPPRPASQRKRGGQPGHKRAVRPMVPPEQLARVVESVPTACFCGAALTGTDLQIIPIRSPSCPRSGPMSSNTVPTA